MQTSVSEKGLYFHVLEHQGEKLALPRHTPLVCSNKEFIDKVALLQYIENPILLLFPVSNTAWMSEETFDHCSQQRALLFYIFKMLNKFVGVT